MRRSACSIASSGPSTTMTVAVVPMAGKSWWATPRVGPSRRIAAGIGQLPSDSACGGSVTGGAGGAVSGGAVAGGAVSGGAVAGGAVSGGAVAGGAVAGGAVVAGAATAGGAVGAGAGGVVVVELVPTAASTSSSAKSGSATDDDVVVGTVVVGSATVVSVRASPSGVVDVDALVVAAVVGRAGATEVGSDAAVGVAVAVSLADASGSLTTKAPIMPAVPNTDTAPTTRRDVRAGWGRGWSGFMRSRSSAGSFGTRAPYGWGVSVA